MMMAADGYYTFTGREGEAIPPGVTRVRIHESVTVIPPHAFYGNRDIEEVDFHIGVKTVEGYAFQHCPSLRRVIMRGVEVIKNYAFNCCKALTYVECDKLEIIRYGALNFCKSLGSINLPSAKIVGDSAFNYCTALTNVEFSDKLESIRVGAFDNCTSLERITIPLKDDIITENGIIQECKNLKHIDLVGGVHETIAALLLEEWKNDMNEKVDSINQILPTARAGGLSSAGVWDAGEKDEAVQLWIRLVLSRIICYKAQHQSFLNEAATTLQHALPQDIMMNNVLPFLELPSYTFEVGGS